MTASPPHPCPSDLGVVTASHGCWPEMPYHALLVSLKLLIFAQCLPPQLPYLSMSSVSYQDSPLYVFLGFFPLSYAGHW